MDIICGFIHCTYITTYIALNCFSLLSHISLHQPTGLHPGVAPVRGAGVEAPAAVDYRLRGEEGHAPRHDVAPTAGGGGQRALAQ